LKGEEEGRERGTEQQLAGSLANNIGERGRPGQEERHKQAKAG